MIEKLLTCFDKMYKHLKAIFSYQMLSDHHKIFANKSFFVFTDLFVLLVSKTSSLDFISLANDNYLREEGRISSF